jgi:hypothetical protein
VCSLLVVIVFGALAFRVTQLQVLSGNRYREMSLHQTQQTVPLPAQRGTIFDRNGQRPRDVDRADVDLCRSEACHRRHRLRGQARADPARQPQGICSSTFPTAASTSRTSLVE